MPGRSYLRRIARPVVAGDPQLKSISFPFANDAQPPALQSTHRHKVSPATAATTPPTADRTEVAAVQAGRAVPQPPSAVEPTPTAVPCSDLPGPGSEARPVPARRQIAHSRTDRSSPKRAASAGDGADNSIIGTEALLDMRPKTVRGPEAMPGSSVHIGMVEVRTQPAPLVPSTAQAPPPRATPPRASAAATPSPLSRGLAWRYGLVQG